MTIRWGSVIANPAGEIEWERIAHLIAALAALVAIGLLLALALTDWVNNADAVDTAVWAGMLPITGGAVAQGISGRLRSRKIAAGEVPGRRAGEGPTGTTAERPIDGGGA